MEEENQTEEKKKILKETLIIGFSITGIIVLIAGIFVFAKSSSAGQISSNNQSEEITDEDFVIDPFSDVRISAHGAYVKDLNSGQVLYSKNSSKALPLASLTKVVTAMTAAEILEDSDLVRIEYKHLEAEGNHNLIPGEHFSFKDLVDFTLITSSNDGAKALAYAAGAVVDTEANKTPEEKFIDEMNKFAQKIGMRNTEFKNESGLDENNETEAGAIGSAKDISVLFEYVLKNEPELLDSTRAGILTVRSKEGFEHHLRNTNQIVNSLPNIVGSKTGYTEVAGGNLAVVIDPALNTPVVIVVLGSSKEGRFKDVERLTNATLDYLTLQDQI